MASLLGLDAYSDDEDSSQQQQLQPSSAQSQASTSLNIATSAPHPSTSILNLTSAYQSDSDEEGEGQRTAHEKKTTELVIQRTTTSSTIPSHSSISASATTPLRPSSSTDSLSSSATSAPMDLTNESDPNPSSSLPSATSSFALDPALLSLLPPLPTKPLAPALAARHQQNLARQKAQAANPKALPLVATLHQNKSFHNPYILQRIAGQLNIDEYGSNLPRGYWTEQNLPDGQEEDDYIAIKRQAEDATAHRLATRTSLEFVPTSSPSPPVPPPSSSSTGGSTVATVNPDGSITRVRVFNTTAPNGAAHSAPSSKIGPSSTQSSISTSQIDVSSRFDRGPQTQPAAVVCTEVEMNLTSKKQKR